MTHLFRIRPTHVARACARRTTVPPLLATTVTHITLSKPTKAKPCLEYLFRRQRRSTPRNDRELSVSNRPRGNGRLARRIGRSLARARRDHLNETACGWSATWAAPTAHKSMASRSRRRCSSDGDILKVAETELTFIASAASQFQTDGDAANSIKSEGCAGPMRCRPRSPPSE